MTGIVEDSICIYPTADPIVHTQIHITADIQARIAVVLTFTEVEQVVGTLVTDVRIEVGVASAARKLGHSVIVLTCLPNIVIGKEVDVRITVRVTSACIVVNLLIRESGIQPVVTQRLVIQRHVFGRSQIFRIAFRHIDTGIGTRTHPQVFIASALRGDKNDSLRTTAAVKHHGLRCLEECDLGYFGRTNVVCLTRDSVYQYQRFAHVP